MTPSKNPLPARNDLATALALAQWLDLWGELSPDTLQVLVDLQDDPAPLVEALRDLGLRSDHVPTDAGEPPASERAKK